MAFAAGGGGSVGRAEVRAVPAYTLRTDFFPRSRGWLGYVVTVGDRTLYHAGATDRIPEMDGIRAETAFLPVSGRFVMGPDEAREAGFAVASVMQGGGGRAGAGRPLRDRGPLHANPGFRHEVRPGSGRMRAGHRMGHVICTRFPTIRRRP